MTSEIDQSSLLMAVGDLYRIFSDPTIGDGRELKGETDAVDQAESATWRQKVMGETSVFIHYMIIKKSKQSYKLTLLASSSSCSLSSDWFRAPLFIQ